MSEKRPYATITHEGSDVVERKRRRVADTFRRDDAMESRLELRDNNPDAFASLPRDERLATAYYSVARAAATQSALDDEVA